jgi:L-alanine-DL-glutamate epimerase-like enolase superfamily enzyme
MKIEALDAFYLRMPEVKDIGDGSQDVLVMRVQAGGFVGWGECEASPLTTIAALIAPLSHSACHPIRSSIVGQELPGPDEMEAFHRRVRERSSDLLQTDHALSGIDIALWDLIGKVHGAPVWSFFGAKNHAKTAYASQLFGDTPSATYEDARSVPPEFRAAKFGWGPFGRAELADDREQLAAAREGVGPNRTLLIDTGCVFGHDVSRAAERIALLEEFHVGWWEEPFAAGALAEYSQLSKQTKTKLAGGEGAHTADQARHLIDYGGVGFIQVDAGRIGGITAARQVANYARQKNVQFVNHTFTSNLALSASLQPYADHPSGYAEVPLAASDLAIAIGGMPWVLDPDGGVSAPGNLGLGVTPEPLAISPYLQEVEIRWNGKTLWNSLDNKL